MLAQCIRLYMESGQRCHDFALRDANFVVYCRQGRYRSHKFRVSASLSKILPLAMYILRLSRLVLYSFEVILDIVGRNGVA